MPADPLARKRAENELLRRRVDELDAWITAVDALGGDVVEPPEVVAETFGPAFAGEVALDPEAAERLATEITRARDAAAAEARELAATEQALAAQWEIDPGELARARLEHARLDRAVAEREAAWREAQRRYLARSRGARVAASEVRDEVERGLAEDEARAAEEERLAAEAQRQAEDAQRSARSEAEALLAAEAARLQGVRREQAAFDKRLVREKTAITESVSSFADLLARLETLAPDQQFEEVVLALGTRRVDALEDTVALFRGGPRPPRPGPLSDTVRALPDVYAERLAELEVARQGLVERAGALRARAGALLRDRARLHHDQAARLNRLRVDLLPGLSQGLKDQVYAIRERAPDQLGGEAVQLAVEVTFWANTRWRQAERVLAGSYGLSEIAWFFWAMIEVLLLLVVLRWMLRRWNLWMLAAVEAVGGSMTLGGWTLFLARVADAARSFGPPLLVLLSAVAARELLGGAAAPPEVQIVYIITFWVAGFRFQLRVVQEIAHYLAERRAEREREQAEAERIEAEAAASVSTGAGATGGDAAAPAPAVADAPKAIAAVDMPVEERAEPPSATALFAKTWRVATGYVAIVVIVRALAGFAVGAGVFYYVAGRVAWYGAIPLGIYFLRAWRPRIVHEYVKWSPKAGALTSLAERHAHRIYGIVILVLVFVVVLFRRAARFARDNLADLDATKRLVAFLFRRRVEKHAQQHGRVLEEPHELPPEITEQFPVGPLSAEDRPTSTAAHEELLAAYHKWASATESRGDGSVAVVGAGGMGKTTLIRQLEAELGKEVVVSGQIRTKITKPATLVRAIARIVGLDDEMTSENELVAALHSRGRCAVLIDDCHNMFLREVGGFDAWEAFTRIISETGDAVFWVASFNGPAWDYLSNVAGGVSYFRQTITLEPWSDVELRRLILTRTRRSRYRPNFTDLLVTRLEGVKTSTQIIRTSQGYFQLLWDFTDGNPRLASYFWLRSLVPDVEARRVRVNLFAAPKLEELEKLPADIVFILAAVVEHENATVSELATICNLEPEFCRFALRYCREHGYLRRDAASGRTKLSLYWQQTIVRFLKRKGLLYS